MQHHKILKEGNQKYDNNHKLTPAQRSICERAQLIFQGDTDKVATAIGAPRETVDAYAKSKNIALPQQNRFITSQSSSRKDKGTKYTSMKNYNQKWLQRIQNKVIHPTFLPCDHDDPCNDNTCSECKAGQCRLNSCPCYASKRECDPDLCRSCGACSDPPGAAATGHGQRCRNDNISMRRKAHILVAQSEVMKDDEKDAKEGEDAMWGIYTKLALKKGDFITEYVGEVISQEEAERRGVIYDKLEASYLFNLSSDQVIDAGRKGNKARYANHSDKPNIEIKMLRVNGDMRIGLFAKHDIDAQSELLFNYRYNEKMENDLIYKPDHSVKFDWM